MSQIRESVAFSVAPVSALSENAPTVAPGQLGWGFRQKPRRQAEFVRETGHKAGSRPCAARCRCGATPLRPRQARRREPHKRRRTAGSGSGPPVASWRRLPRASTTAPRSSGDHSAEHKRNGGPIGEAGKARGRLLHVGDGDHEVEQRLRAVRVREPARLPYGRFGPVGQNLDAALGHLAGLVTHDRECRRARPARGIDRPLHVDQRADRGSLHRAADERPRRRQPKRLRGGCRDGARRPRRTRGRAACRRS